LVTKKIKFMKNIGLIDDKDIPRRAFMLRLNIKLKQFHEGWSIIDSKPFKDKETYRQWILENEISVLITDERLDEGPLEDGTNVDYFGSDLVVELRKYFKDIPIYCITNIAVTDKLKSALSYFNLILSKKNFDEGIENYLNLFVKSGESFYKEYETELSRFGELSEKIANRTASVEEHKELKTLQTTLLIPHVSGDLTSREEHIDKMEKALENLVLKHEELKKYLESKK
jgi:hypothetical protein